MTRPSYYIFLLFLVLAMLAIPLSILYKFTVKRICTDFDSQEQAQRAFDKDPVRYDNLDRDNDNKACEDLPQEQPSILFRGGFREPRPFTTVPPKTTPAPTPVTIELKGEATVHVERPSEATESPTPSPEPTPVPNPTPAPSATPEPNETPTPTPLVCVGSLCIGGGIL